MQYPTRLLLCALASGLAVGCGSSRRDAANQPEFLSENVYVVETKNGEIFSTLIEDFDADSLYFRDGTAIHREEVGSVRQQGKTSDGRDLPGAVQTRPN